MRSLGRGPSQTAGIDLRLEVRFRSEAASDVVLAREWYDSKRPELGDDFARSLDQVIQLVSELPAAGVSRTALRWDGGLPLHRTISGPYPLSAAHPHILPSHPSA